MMVSMATLMASPAALFDFDSLAVPDVAMIGPDVTSCAAAMSRMSFIHKNSRFEKARAYIAKGYSNWRSMAPQARARAIAAVNGSRPIPEGYGDLVTTALDEDEMSYAAQFAILFEKFRQTARNLGKLSLESIEQAYLLIRTYENRLLKEWRTISEPDNIRYNFWKHLYLSDADRAEWKNLEGAQVKLPASFWLQLRDFIERLAHETSLVKSLSIEDSLGGPKNLRSFLSFIGLVDVISKSSPLLVFHRGSKWLTEDQEAYLNHLAKFPKFPYPAMGLESGTNAFLRLIFEGLDESASLGVFRSNRPTKFGELLLVNPYFQLGVTCHGQNFTGGIKRVQLWFLEAKVIRDLVLKPVSLSPTATPNIGIAEGEAVRGPDLASEATLDDYFQPSQGLPPFAQNAEPMVAQRYEIPSQLKEFVSQWTDSSVQTFIAQVEKHRIRDDRERVAMDSLCEILFAEYEELVYHPEIHQWLLSQMHRFREMKVSLQRLEADWRAILYGKRVTKLTDGEQGSGDMEFRDFVIGKRSFTEIRPGDSYRLNVGTLHGETFTVAIVFWPETLQFLKEHELFVPRILRSLQKGVVAADGTTGVKVIHKHPRAHYEVKVYGRGIGHKRVGIVEEINGVRTWHLKEVIDWR